MLTLGFALNVIVEEGVAVPNSIGRTVSSNRLVALHTGSRC